MATWEDQSIAGATWDELAPFKESPRYTELTATTYEDMFETRYDANVWVDQPIASGPWA